MYVTNIFIYTCAIQGVMPDRDEMLIISSPSNHLIFTNSFAVRQN